MSESERVFLLVGCHVQNEISLLNKLFVLAIPRPGEGAGFDQPMASQALILAKLMAGKMSEAWLSLEKVYFGKSKLSYELADELDDDTDQALADLKRYFGRANAMLRNVRDNFAFHYNAEKIATSWAQAATEPNFEILFGESYGNTFYLGAEHAANIAMLNFIEPGNLQKAIEKFYEDINYVRNRFSRFFEGVADFILKRHLGDDLASYSTTRHVELSVEFAKVRIPLFTVMPDTAS